MEPFNLNLCFKLKGWISCALRGVTEPLYFKNITIFNLYPNINSQIIVGGSPDEQGITPI